MRGIQIELNGVWYDTGDDFGCVMEKKEIERPKVQSHFVEVPGRNGLLNLTSGLTGRVTYFNRNLKYRFFRDGKRSELLEIDAYFSALHGKTCRIFDEDYLGYYFEGEITVESKFYPNYMIVELTVNAQPFRFKFTTTVKSANVYTSSINMTIHNEQMPTAPTIRVVGDDVTITFKGTSVTLRAGYYTVDKFILESGNNIFTLKSNGSSTVTFEYQEGAI